MPSEETIRVKLTALGYTLHSVQKSRPQTIKETDAIFEQLASVHAQAREDASILRVSMDAKAGGKVGPFSRRGKTRAECQAADHDFKPDAVLTPFGIFWPDQDEIYFYFTASSVTADFIWTAYAMFGSWSALVFPMSPGGY